MTDQAIKEEPTVEEINQEAPPDSRYQEVLRELQEENPTVEELRAYARENDIGLQGATRKDVIAGTITAALIIREQVAQETESVSTPEPSPTPAPEAAPKTAPTPEPAPAPKTASAIDGRGLPRAVHWKRLIVPTNDATERIAATEVSIETVQSAQQYIEDVYFANGYEISAVSHISIESTAELAGHNIMFVLTRPEGREPQHSEVYMLITQVGGLSGFQADSFLSSYLEQGWDMIHFETFGFTEAGINCFWVLAR